MNVKKTFFITKKMSDELNKRDGFISHRLPHYELEDGTIMYGKVGYPDGEAWWSEHGICFTGVVLRKFNKPK